MWNNDGCIIYIQRILICQIFYFIPDHLCNLPVGPLASFHVVDHVDHFFWTEEVPKTIRRQDEEFVIRLWNRVNMERRLWHYADLMWDQVADRSRDFQAWVHSSSQKDPLKPIARLTNLSFVIVNSELFFVSPGSVSWLIDKFLPLIWFSTNEHFTITNPPYVQLFGCLKYQNSSGPTQQNIKHLLMLISGANSAS